MTYEEQCRAFGQPGIPAHLAPLSGMVLETQQRRECERQIAEGQARILVWLAAQRREETRMTRRCLFTALAEVATTLQAECARICFSPHQIALTAIVERLDVIIDQILEEGVHEEDEPHG